MKIPGIYMHKMAPKAGYNSRYVPLGVVEKSRLQDRAQGNHVLCALILGDGAVNIIRTNAMNQYIWHGGVEELTERELDDIIVVCENWIDTIPSNNPQTAIQLIGSLGKLKEARCSLALAHSAPSSGE